MTDRVKGVRRWRAIGVLATIGCGIGNAVRASLVVPTVACTPCQFTVCPSHGGDDTKTIQDAFDHAVSSGEGLITFGPGIYNVSITPGQTAMLHLKGPNLQLVGPGTEPFAATLRVVDQAGAYTAMIDSPPGVDLSGLRIQNLTFDENLANNPVTASDVCGWDALKPCNEESNNCRWVLYLNRASPTVTGADSIEIDSNYFNDIDDVNVIEVNALADQQAGTPGVASIAITNNQFTNIGGSDGSFPHDHSTLSILAGTMTISGNQFYGTGPAATTAIETHGGNQIVTRNFVANYANGANLSGQAPAGTGQVTADHNLFAGVNTGFSLWSFFQNPPTDGGMSPTISMAPFKGLGITCNQISVNPANWYDSCATHGQNGWTGNWVSGSNGIDTVQNTGGFTYAGFQDLTIQENAITYEPTSNVTVPNYRRDQSQPLNEACNLPPACTPFPLTVCSPTQNPIPIQPRIPIQSWSKWSFFDPQYIEDQKHLQAQTPPSPSVCADAESQGRSCAAPAADPQWLPRDYDSNSAGILDHQPGSTDMRTDSTYTITKNEIHQPPAAGIWVDHQPQDAGAPLPMLASLSVTNNRIFDPGWGCNGTTCVFPSGYVGGGVVLGGNLSQACITNNLLSEDRPSYPEGFVVDTTTVTSSQSGGESGNGTVQTSLPTPIGDFNPPFGQPMGFSSSCQ
jgi:hypothetical protein